MISVWSAFWAFGAGCVVGFCFYGCIDWKNDNHGNEFNLIKKKKN